MIVVGLGNPGEEYEKTRHNAGRLLVEHAAGTLGADFHASGKYQSHAAEAKIKKTPILFLLPNTYMNKSGGAVKNLITSKKKAAELVVVADEMDLPFGKIRISFGRGSGGHNGVESIIKAVKTKDFVRVRVGVSPATPSGKIRKPVGEKKVLDFLLGEFSKKELEGIKKLGKTMDEVIETIATEGYLVAMNRFN